MALVVRISYQYRKTDRAVLTFLAIFKLTTSPSFCPSSFLIFTSYFFLRADDPFCASAFCSSRLYRRSFAFSCFALPRRHCSTASTALGASLNVWATASPPFSFSFSLLLSFSDSVGLSIWPDRYVLWRHSRLVGLAMTRWERRPKAFSTLRTAWLAVLIIAAIGARFVYGSWRATHSGSTAPPGRSTFADDRFRNTTFAGSRWGTSGLYPDLLHWSVSPAGGSSPTFQRPPL